MARTRVTIYCHCTYSEVIPNRVKFAVLDAIENAGMEVEAVPDLWELSAKRDPVLKIWAKAESTKTVACYPRAVKWLFHAGQAPLPKEGVEFLNMRVDSPEKIISSLLDDQAHLKSSKFKMQNVKLRNSTSWIFEFCLLNSAPARVAEYERRAEWRP
ncbi:MAG: hypothetical protein ACETVZ_09060 [Phycisphaerae bacterium]